MYNKSYDQLLIIQAAFESNRQYSDGKYYRRPQSNDHINYGSDYNLEILTRQEGSTKFSGSYHYGTG